MLSVLELNYNGADALSLEVSVLCSSGHTLLSSGGKGAWTARAVEEMSCTHFYHLWSEEARKGIMCAHNYKPGACSTVC